MIYVPLYTYMAHFSSIFSHFRNKLLISDCSMTVKTIFTEIICSIFITSLIDNNKTRGMNDDFASSVYEALLVIALVWKMLHSRRH